MRYPAGIWEQPPPQCYGSLWGQASWSRNLYGESLYWEQRSATHPHSRTSLPSPCSAPHHHALQMPKAKSCPGLILHGIIPPRHLFPTLHWHHSCCTLLGLSPPPLHTAVHQGHEGSEDSPATLSTPHCPVLELRGMGEGAFWLPKVGTGIICALHFPWVRDISSQPMLNFLIAIHTKHMHAKGSHLTQQQAATGKTFPSLFPPPPAEHNPS